MSIYGFIDYTFCLEVLNQAVICLLNLVSDFYTELISGNRFLVLSVHRYMDSLAARNLYDLKFPN